MKKYLWSIVIVLLSASFVQAQTSYKSYVGQEDVKSWNGYSRTFDRRTSTGGTVAMHSIGNEVDVAWVYGQGTPSDAALATAISLIGANKATIVLGPGTWAISSNHVIPSTMTLKTVRGTIITNAGGTLTLPAGSEIPVEAFSGSNLSTAVAMCPSTNAITISVNSAITLTASVVIPSNFDFKVNYGGKVTVGAFTVTGLKYAEPEWFGAKHDGVTNDTVAINAALAAAAGGKVYFPALDTYLVTGNLLLTGNGTIMEGASRYLTKIKFTPSAAGTLLRVALASGGSSVTPMWQPRIRNLTLTSSDTTYVKTAIDWVDVHQGGIDNVSITGFKDTTKASMGIHFYGRDEDSFRDIYIDCDRPIVVDQNPILLGTPSGLEYVNFHNIGTAAASTQANIEVSGNMSLAAVTITGSNFFSGGLHGIYAPQLYNNILQPSLYISNITWDRPGDASGWFVYIDPSPNGNLLNVTLKNLVAYTGDYTGYNGFYVSDFDPAQSSFEGLVYTGAVGNKWGGDLTDTYKMVSIGPSVVLNSGTALCPSGYAVIDASAIVPNTAREVWGYASCPSGNASILLSPKSDGTGYLSFVGAGTYTFPFRLPLLTRQTLYYCVSSNSATVIISGYSY